MTVLTILVAPVLALVGVGLGARLARSDQERQWLRDSRLQAYSAYLAACNSYDVASRQLQAALKAGHNADGRSARDTAMVAIRDVAIRQESVLLLGSPDVQRACTSTTDALYRGNESNSRLLEGRPAAGDSGDGQALRQAIEAFRAAVRSELESGQVTGWRATGRRLPTGRRGSRLNFAADIRQEFDDAGRAIDH